MAEDRKERILIPAATVLGTTFLTLWFGLGLNKDPAIWFGVQPGDFKGVISLVLTIGVANYGLGYLCNAIHTSIWMVCRRERFVNFHRLTKIFGIPDTKNYCWKQRRELEHEILGAFHLRLHSHAPQSLIDWCSRRNSAWFVSRACVFAVVIGYALGLVIMAAASKGAGFSDAWWNTHREAFLWVSIPVLAIASIVLWLQGNRWNREFWEVCWKWLDMDVRLRPLAGK